MYDEAVLEGLTARLVERQDEPTRLLEDLRAVRDEKIDEGLPRQYQRFQLNLEMDRDDMDFVIERVEALVEDEQSQ